MPVPEPTLNELKNTLRKKIRARIKELSAADRAAASRALIEQLYALPAWATARHIAAYAALPDEVDLSPLLQRVLDEGRQLSLPRYEADSDTWTWAPCRALEDLKPGMLGVPQVAPSAPCAPEPDLILVPARALDRQGTRLGRGKAYYDRMLKDPPALKIGVVFHLQILDHLPREAHDIPMDQVLSECGILYRR